MPLPLIPILIGVVAASTVASVGTTAYAVSEQEDLTDKTIENQKTFTLLSAWVDFGVALNQAPGAIPTA
jgi:hypothetical protein